MTPEEHELLKKTVALAEENNTMLRKIRGSQRVSSVMRWLYWIAIIALSVASYSLIQPYVNTLQSVIGSIK